jgi:hypothetical protein
VKYQNFGDREDDDAEKQQEMTQINSAAAQKRRKSYETIQVDDDGAADDVQSPPQEPAVLFFWPPTIYITPLTQEDAILSRLPFAICCCCCKFLFLPSGVWAASQRDFNRKFGALFFPYTFEGASWAPTASLLFLLVIAVVVSAQPDACSAPLTILGVLLAIFGLLFLVLRPYRTALGNALVIVQYFVGAALAFSKAQGFASHDALFIVILAIAAVSLAHGLIQFVVEECFLYPVEFSKFVVINNSKEKERKP